MLKKVLIVVGILVALAVAAFSLVVFEAGKKIDEAFKSKEPEFRQYLTMTGDEQNAYVEKNMEGILSVFIGNSRDMNDEEFWSNLQNDADAKAAGIQLGRSIIAAYILDSKTMADALNAEIKTWLNSDKDATETRATNYAKFLEKYDTTKK